MDMLVRLLETGGLGGVISLALEQIPQFQGLDSKIKFWVAVGLSAVLSLALRAALLYLPEWVWEGVEPWFRVVMATVLGNQIVHRYVNAHGIKVPTAFTERIVIPSKED